MYATGWRAVGFMFSGTVGVGVGPFNEWWGGEHVIFTTVSFYADAVVDLIFGVSGKWGIGINMTFKYATDLNYMHLAPGIEFLFGLGWDHNRRRVE